MGTPKPLLVFEGETLLARLAHVLREGGADDVIAVVGPGSDFAVDATVVVNPGPERGMLSSVQCGLRELPEDRALLVCPCDLPLLLPGHVAAVIDGWSGDAEAIVRPVQSGKGGHPTLFGPGLREEILALDPARSGLNALCRNYLATDIEIGDPGPFCDADTPEEWARLNNG
jgi:molybdenum cofactor cytidylyltransferase